MLVLMFMEIVLKLLVFFLCCNGFLSFGFSTLCGLVNVVSVVYVCDFAVKLDDGIVTVDSLNGHFMTNNSCFRLHAVLVQRYSLYVIYRCLRISLYVMLLNLRFIVLKLAEVWKEVQCPICLGMYFNLSVS